MVGIFIPIYRISEGDDYFCGRQNMVDIIKNHVSRLISILVAWQCLPVRVEMKVGGTCFSYVKEYAYDII